MKDALVTFDTAILAKNAGFDVPTAPVYYLRDTEKLEGTELGVIPQNHNFYKPRVSVPTQNLLQKWLRENHDIHLVISRKYEWHLESSPIFEGWNVHIDVPIGHKELSNTVNKYYFYAIFDTYEDAIEAGLLQALRYIVNCWIIK